MYFLFLDLFIIEFQNSSEHDQQLFTSQTLSQDIFSPTGLRPLSN